MYSAIAGRSESTAHSLQVNLRVLKLPHSVTDARPNVQVFDVWPRIAILHPLTPIDNAKK